MRLRHSASEMTVSRMSETTCRLHALPAAPCDTHVSTDTERAETMHTSSTRTPRELRVALLICDHPAADVERLFGNYTILFARLLSDACRDYTALHSASAQNAPLVPSFAVFDTFADGSVPQNLAAFDVFVLTGSSASAYEPDTPWIQRLSQFIRDVVAAHEDHAAHPDTPVPGKLVGICFGHQLIAQALGGTVIKNPAGWEVGPTAVSLTESGCSFFAGDTLATTILKPSSVLRLRSSSPVAGSPPKVASINGEVTFIINQMHQDHVTEVPPKFVVLASNAISPVQAMVRENFIFAYQGHPEFPVGFVKSLVNIRAKKGIFAGEFLNNVLANINTPTDGAWLAFHIIRFVLGQ